MKRRQPINHLFAMFGRCTCNHSVSLQQSVIGLSHSFTHCWCIARSDKLLAMDCQLQLQEYLRQNLIIIMLPPPMISFFYHSPKLKYMANENYHSFTERNLFNMLDHLQCIQDILQRESTACKHGFCVYLHRYYLLFSRTSLTNIIIITFVYLRR